VAFIYRQEKLKVIEMDQNEYTLDEEGQKVQQVVLKPNPCVNDSVVLKKSFSRSYPNCSFHEALRTENEKLRLELYRSQANLDAGECEVIQQLLDVTDTVAVVCQAEELPVNYSKSTEANYPDEKESYYDKSPKKSDTSRSVFQLANFRRCLHLAHVEN